MILQLNFLSIEGHICWNPAEYKYYYNVHLHVWSLNCHANFVCLVHMLLYIHSNDNNIPWTSTMRPGLNLKYEILPTGHIMLWNISSFNNYTFKWFCLQTRTKQCTNTTLSLINILGALLGVLERQKDVIRITLLVWETSLITYSLAGVLELRRVIQNTLVRLGYQLYTTRTGGPTWNTTYRSPNIKHYLQEAQMLYC